MRRVDEIKPNLVIGGGQLLTTGNAPVATPAFPSAPAPQNVIVSSGQALLRTTYTPKILVAVAWDAPVNLQPELYSIESAEDVNFNSNLQRWSTVLTSGVIELKPNTNYWIRVQAVIRGVYSEYGYPANYPVASIHTISDTTAPGPVTSVVTDWSTGDLEFSWTNPTSDNFFQTRLRIYNTFGGTLYKEVKVVGNPGSTSRWAFTVDDNNKVTANNPLTSVYYELLAYSIAGVPSATTITGTVTKAKPNLPIGLTSTWTNDDGTYDEGVTFSWLTVSGAEYRITIDGLAKITRFPRYVYNYTENVSDHRPTLVSGDFSLAYTVQALDPLGQLSGGASGTATNLAPSSSNLTLSYVAGFSSLYAFVTPTTEIKDLYGYRWTLKSGGVTVQTTLSFTPEVTFNTLNGNYALEIYAIDLFGRKSTTISGVNIILDGLTIDQLRSETKYTNSIGTNPTTLDGLKDGDLLTNVVTIASGTAWKWTKAERPLLDRYHAVTLAVSGAATNWPVVYFGVSVDDNTYRWFAGPITGNYGTVLTEHASETIAQASGVLLSTNINRFDLPQIVESRFVKMGHRGNTHNLTEYYPRRIIQSDDGELESLKAINIAAQTITADKIQVFSLNASTATISGILSIGLSGGLYQGTGTFASPLTGLKIYNTNGIGRFTLYSGGIEQVGATTNGILTAGAGHVRLTSSGIILDGMKAASEAATNTPFYQIRWVNQDIPSRNLAGIYAEVATGLQDTHQLHVRSQSPSSSFDSSLVLYADSANNGVAGGVPYIQITNLSNLTTRTIDVVAGTSITLQSTLTTVSDGLKVGSPANTPGTGVIRTSSSIVSEANSIQSLGTNAGLVFEDRTSAQDWQWYATSAIARLYNGTNDTVSITDAGLLTVMETDAGTTNVVDLINLRRDSTGTPGVGFGSNLRMNLETSTTSDQPAAVFQVTWQTATHASRKARITMHAYDTVAREFIRGEASGTAAMLGFYGSAATAKQTITGTRTGTLAQLQTVVANMLTAIATLGLWTDSTT